LRGARAEAAAVAEGRAACVASDASCVAGAPRCESRVGSLLRGRAPERVACSEIGLGPCAPGDGLCATGTPTTSVSPADGPYPTRADHAIRCPHATVHPPRRVTRSFGPWRATSLLGSRQDVPSYGLRHRPRPRAPAFESAEEKRTNPGRRRFFERWSGRACRFTFSPVHPSRCAESSKTSCASTDPVGQLHAEANLQNLLRLRFRAMRDQLGTSSRHPPRATACDSTSPRRPRLTTRNALGDDAEADAFVYSLYADVLEGRVSGELLGEICARGRSTRT